MKAIVAALVTAITLGPVMSRDLGQWDKSDPKVRDWYKSLMMPDRPDVPCCGEADAYWCDEYFARDGKAYCRINDDREVPRRPYIPNGTEILIPSHKLKYSDGNPTGHGVVFVGKGDPMNSGLDRYITYCYVQGEQV